MSDDPTITTPAGDGTQGGNPDAGTTPPAPPAAPDGVSYVRVRAIPSAVVHPEHGGFVTPRPGDRYRTDDPLVQTYGWMFEDQDTPEAEDAPESVRIGPVEQATAAPGERSQARRPGNTGKKARG